MATGVHEEAQEDDVADKFADFGDVKNIQVNLDRRSGFVKGYALIEYKRFEQAKDAIESMDGKNLLGAYEMRLVVNVLGLIHYWARYNLFCFVINPVSFVVSHLHIHTPPTPSSGKAVNVSWAFTKGASRKVEATA